MKRATVCQYFSFLLPRNQTEASTKVYTYISLAPSKLCPCIMQTKIFPQLEMEIHMPFSVNMEQVHFHKTGRFPLSNIFSYKYVCV